MTCVYLATDHVAADPWIFPLGAISWIGTGDPSPRNPTPGAQKPRKNREAGILQRGVPSNPPPRILPTCGVQLVIDVPNCAFGQDVSWAVPTDPFQQCACARPPARTSLEGQVPFQLCSTVLSYGRQHPVNIDTSASFRLLRSHHHARRSASRDPPSSVLKRARSVEPFNPRYSPTEPKTLPCVDAHDEER